MTDVEKFCVKAFGALLLTHSLGTGLTAPDDAPLMCASVPMGGGGWVSVFKDATSGACNRLANGMTIPEVRESGFDPYVAAAPIGALSVAGWKKLLGLEK